jgi:hypothetical protein
MVSDRFLMRQRISFRIDSYVRQYGSSLYNSQAASRVTGSGIRAPGSLRRAARNESPACGLVGAGSRTPVSYVL